jgi:hypothetical protein
VGGMGTYLLVISYCKRTSDGLSVLMKFIELKKNVHLEHLHKIHVMEKKKSKGFFFNIPHQQSL